MGSPPKNRSLLFSEKNLRHISGGLRSYVLFELSRRFQEPSFFESQKSIDRCTFDRREIAEVAVELGRNNAAHELLIAAAEQGDTDAMSDLVERYGCTCLPGRYRVELLPDLIDHRVLMSADAYRNRKSHF